MLSAAAGRVDPSDASQFVQNALDGMARYGSGSIDLWTATFKVLDVMGDGPSTVVAALPTTLFMGSESAGHWMQAGYKVSSNVLGWARFGYTCLVKIVVTITQNVLLNVPVGPGRAWRIVVNTLDEMRDHYESDVVDNIRQSCAGISLMMGLTNPWAVFVYQQCVAANTAVEAGVDVALSVFNLAPFAQCMCTGTAGKVFGDYAMAYCVPQASTSLRPVLLQMIQASSATPVGNALPQSQALCQDMINDTKAQLMAAVQPWFDAQFASMNALGASLDYAISWLDPTAGPRRGRHHALPRGLLPGVWGHLPLPGQVQRDLGGLRGQPERRGPVHPDLHRLRGEPLLPHAQRGQAQPHDDLGAPRASRVHLRAGVRGDQRRCGQLLRRGGRDQGAWSSCSTTAPPRCSPQRLPHHGPLARVGLPGQLRVGRPGGDGQPGRADQGLLGITVSFPDDAFFGYVCTAKDQSAHLISIFTSAINDAVQIAHSAVLYLQGGAQEGACVALGAPAARLLVCGLRGRPPACAGAHQEPARLLVSAAPCAADGSSRLRTAAAR